MKEKENGRREGWREEERETDRRNRNETQTDRQRERGTVTERQTVSQREKLHGIRTYFGEQMP